MTFADEPCHRSSRRFDCGWSVRRETAADIAARLQELARRLATIDPAYGLIRPDPGMRKFRPGDWGPILDMTSGELTDLVERRGRFDAPRFPAPVSPQGYDMMYRNDRLDLSHLSVKVGAGGFGVGANRNEIWVWPDSDHAVWRNVERGTQVLDAMAECWDAEWASAYGFKASNEGIRPWLAWTAEPLRLEPVPPYIQPYPYPFALDNVPPPAEVRPWHGGELRIWP